MKRILNVLCGAVAIALVLSSCKGNAPKEAKYIPKDATAIWVLDPKQMQDKLQKGGISIDTLINRFFNNDGTDERDKAHLRAAKDSAGIDWSSKWFFVMRQSVKGRTPVAHVAVMGGLKDAKQFETFIVKSLSDDGAEHKVIAEKDYKYVTFGEGIIAWNDEEVTLSGYLDNPKPVFDTATMGFRQPEKTDFSADAKQAVALMFTQKTSESMANEKKFTEIFKDKADGYLYYSTASVSSMLSLLPFQPPKLDEMVKDNYSTATLSFEDGKVLMKGTLYLNQLLSSILKKYPAPNADLAMIENYPSQSINGFTLFSFNPEAIGGMMKQLEIEGLANASLAKAGITSEDIYKALKGQIMLAVSDVGMPSADVDPMDKTNEKNMLRKKPAYKLLLNATVADKARFFKLMDIAAATGTIVKEGEVYKGGPLLAAMGVFVRADGNNLIVANDSTTYAQYMAKTSKAAIKKDVLDRMKDKVGIFYFDIAKTFASFGIDSLNGSGYDHSIVTAKNTFNDVIYTVDNFDGSKMKLQMELRLQNEKENSLVTLVSLISDLAADMRAKHKKEKEAERMFPGGVPAIIRTN